MCSYNALISQILAHLEVNFVIIKVVCAIKRIWNLLVLYCMLYWPTQVPIGLHQSKAHIGTLVSHYNTHYKAKVFRSYSLFMLWWTQSSYRTHFVIFLFSKFHYFHNNISALFSNFIPISLCFKYQDWSCSWCPKPKGCFLARREYTFYILSNENK